MKIGYTTGVYDLFHIGHLNILKEAKSQCDFLIVGISTDELVKNEKNKETVIPFEERKEIVKAIKYVDKVVTQFNKNKLEAYSIHKFNRMFVGSDWEGTIQWKTFEKQFKPLGVDIIYIPHTDGISSTILSKKLGIRE